MTSLVFLAAVICTNERNVSQRGSSYCTNNDKRALDNSGGYFEEEQMALFSLTLASLLFVLHSMPLFLCSPQEVRFTLDRCSGAAVMEMEGLGSWLTTQDHSSCEVTGVTPNTDRYTETPECTHSLCKGFDSMCEDVQEDVRVIKYTFNGPRISHILVCCQMRDHTVD